MSLISKAFRDEQKAMKEAIKLADKFYDNVKDSEPYKGMTKLDYIEFWRKKNIEKYADEINRVCDNLESEKYGSAMNRLLSVVGQPKLNKAKQWYFITIRPNDETCKIEELVENVNKLISRSCFIKGCYSYEQKGIDETQLGKGFHCHLVCETKHRSKGECLRDVKSTFRGMINNNKITENNIDVRTTNNPEELIESYLIDYKSDDGHKEATQAWDELWRTGMTLERLYKFE